MSDQEPRRDVSRRGRAFGLVVFGLIVGGLTAIMSAQIIRDVFWPPRQELTVSCGEALRGMWHALERARQSAAGQVGASESVRAFRASLAPEWQRLASVEQHCAADRHWARTTKELVALRYAEERLVRLQARDVNEARGRLGELFEHSAR